MLSLLKTRTFFTLKGDIGETATTDAYNPRLRSHLEEHLVGQVTLSFAGTKGGEDRLKILDCKSASVKSVCSRVAALCSMSAFFIWPSI